MNPVPHRAYISLGSNLGDRLVNLREAIRRLGSIGEVKRVSSFYETEPVEFTAQPWFVNAVAELQTEHAPVELLRALLELERAMGRERKILKGPRTIDLDLLLYDDQTVNTPELTLPHPSFHERRFVLVPLAEIAPEEVHPKMRKAAWQLLESLRPGAQVRRLEAPSA